MLTLARFKLPSGVRSVRPGFRRMSEQVQAPKRDVLGIVFFSGICVLAGGLGVWQTQRYLKFYSRKCKWAFNVFFCALASRYYWKVDLIQRIKSSTNEPPAVIGECKSQEEFFNKAAPFRGQRVLLTGRFDHSRGETHNYVACCLVPTLEFSNISGELQHAQKYFLDYALLLPA